VLYLPRRSVVISVDEVDRLAGNLIAIEGDCLWSSHAEVPEEIEHVIRLHRRIHALHNSRVHLMRACERTVAVTNDVEVPEMKVGRKPSVNHDDPMQESCFLVFEVVTVSRSASTSILTIDSAL
jgi:hypothetical protein